MNRYQFEDSISAYLENDLSLSKRIVFEKYLEVNPESKVLIEDVRLIIKEAKSLKAIKVSGEFMPNLFKRIEFEKNRPSKKIIEKPSKTLFGFTPLFASLMTVLIVSFVSVAINLFQETNLSNSTIPKFTGDINNSNNVSINRNPEPPILVTNKASIDSADTTIYKKNNVRFNKKLQLVKDENK